METEQPKKVRQKKSPKPPKEPKVILEKPYTNKWIYKESVIESIEDMPKKVIGYIYLITQKSTGMKYIGRKMCFSTTTVTVKGVKKKVQKESDWKHYYSSSPEIQALVTELGEDDFKREIIIYCYSKSEMLYCEEYMIYTTHALLSPEWYNRNIRSKIYQSWFNKSPNLKQDLLDIKI